MPTKFILYEAIPNPGPNVRLIQMPDPVGRDLSIQMMIRPSSVGVIEVALAYAIDATAYSAEVEALSQ